MIETSARHKCLSSQKRIIESIGNTQFQIQQLNHLANTAKTPRKSNQISRSSWEQI